MDRCMNVSLFASDVIDLHVILLIYCSLCCRYHKVLQLIVAIIYIMCNYFVYSCSKTKSF